MRRRRTVHRVIAGLLAILITAGCGIPVPGRVAPTLGALRGVGFRCGEPHRDNVPSGLLQWSCDRLDGGVPVSVLVDGDDKGVFEVTALVRATTGVATARDVFVDLVTVVPAFDELRPEALRWLREWTSASDRLTVGRGSLVVSQDAIWISLAAFPGPRSWIGDPI